MGIALEDFAGSTRRANYHSCFASTYDRCSALQSNDFDGLASSMKGSQRDTRFHIAMCLRVLRDALVSQVEYLFISASGGRALLQAKGLWLEQIQNMLLSLFQYLALMEACNLCHSHRPHCTVGLYHVISKRVPSLIHDVIPSTFTAQWCISPIK